ncbi:hypothetical protein [Gymnodinialimonas sp. 57CJ19]|uniref:hypothetical protein n=1 Tax=Gymnodinialimonas sp. 57CJ19 TaxID=3138498 RepID=UPI00313452EF
MAQKTTKGQGTKSAKPGREDRLKAALKANMGRRKAQTRARAAAGDDQDQTGKPVDE